MLDVHYAELDGRLVAYATFGEGPVDLLYVGTGWLRVEALASGPVYRRLVRPLTSFSRVIAWDDFGTGLSDPIRSVDEVTLGDWAREALAVAHAARSERFAMFCHDVHGTALGVYLATEFPNRVSHLVLVQPSAKLVRTDGYDVGYDSRERFLTGADRIRRGWRGSGPIPVAPSLGDADANEIRAYQRRSVSPGVAADLMVWCLGVDVRDRLAAVQAPTLVLQGPEVPRDEMGRFVADAIPNAILVELGGPDFAAFGSDAPRIVSEAARFVVGTERLPAPDHRLRAVLFTDIVSSTQAAVASGDKVWRDTVVDHNLVCSELVRAFSGEPIKSTGDGVLAVFEGVADAVSCACAIRDRLRRAGLDIRAGVHAGDVALLHDDVTGLTVTIARRVCDSGNAGDVLVSEAVPLLLAGDEIGFGERGRFELRGVPGSWGVFEVRT